jgi:hypothetical protein
MLRVPVLLLAAGVAFAQTDWENITPDPSFIGWTRLPLPPEKPLEAASQWRVEGGTVICEGNGPHEWLRFDRELGDFIFQVEWRFTRLPGEPRYNSGIFVRNSADGKIWHQGQTGGASGGFLFADTLVNGAVTRVNLRERMKEQRVKPAGEWNAYELRCEGRKITLSVNGAVTSEFTECELPRGYLGLEAEGFRIEFRNLRIKPLR